MGSLGDVTGGNLALMLPVITAGLVLSVAVIKPLNLLLLGENYARHDGSQRPAHPARCCSSPRSCSQAPSRPSAARWGFIGLAVPHIARLMLGSSNHKMLVPRHDACRSCIALLCNILMVMPGTQ